MTERSGPWSIWVSWKSTAASASSYLGMRLICGCCWRLECEEPRRASASAMRELRHPEVFIVCQKYLSRALSQVKT